METLSTSINCELPRDGLLRRCESSPILFLLHSTVPVGQGCDETPGG